VLDLRPAPEFEGWLARMDLLDDTGRVRDLAPDAPAARALLAAALP
jgi:ethanolamine ammonia-lyase large subunit